MQERAQDAQIKLEGRIAGPWTEELSRVWMEASPRVSSKRLVIDLRDVTYADAHATHLLREIYVQTHAELITGTLWTQSLAEVIKQGDQQKSEEL